MVETAEWKEMLEKSQVTGEFLRSAEARNQLRTDYEQLKGIMTELGLTR